ncbi:MAG TPA: phosphatidylglycerol lysyltransferase domain-containing protein [Ktedonobacteraceae bacterium]|jgi:hypothetical protein
MIPVFPLFKQLDLADKEEFETKTKCFLPYSDYNFVSLWSFNTKKDIEISILHDNLVIKFTDYITTKPFYSFLGTNQVNETIDILLEFSKKNKLPSELKLIPEVCIGTLKDSQNYTIFEDRDNFDYILSAKVLCDLSGHKYLVKRNRINRFKKNYDNHSISVLDLKKDSTRDEIINLFHLWGKQKNQLRAEAEIELTVNELTAIKRLLDDANLLNLYSVGIYCNSSLIALSINELVQDSYAMTHFEKADTSYTGVFQYLKHITAELVYKLGILYLNYEQDSGIEGLREAKESYHPISFLKKYIISSN